MAIFSRGQTFTFITDLGFYAALERDGHDLFQDFGDRRRPSMAVFRFELPVLLSVTGLRLDWGARRGQSRCGQLRGVRWSG